MADSTIFPSGLRYFQWSTLTYPKPRLASGISSTATSLVSTAPALDRDGNVIPGDFIMGIRKTTGFVEGIYVPAGTLDYDGQTANFTVGELVTGGTSGATARVLSDSDAGTTGTLTLYNVNGTFQNNEAITGSSTGVAVVNGTLTNSVSASGTTISNLVRGIDLEGLDYNVGDSTQATDHAEDSPIFCSVHPVIQEMLINVIQGGMMSGGQTFSIGRDRDENLIIYFENGDANPPYFKYIAASNKFVIANDGVSEVDVASGGVQTAGNGLDLTAGTLSVDLQASNSGLEFSSGKLRIIPGVLQTNSFTTATDSGSANTYVMTLAPAVPSYSNGLGVILLPANTNTGASTLNLNGVGATAILNSDGSALSGGEIVQNVPVHLIYSNSNFYIVSHPANATSPSDLIIQSRTLGRVFNVIDLLDTPTTSGTGNTSVSGGKITFGTGTTAGGYARYITQRNSTTSLHDKNPCLSLSFVAGLVTGDFDFVCLLRQTNTAPSNLNGTLTERHVGLFYDTGTVYVSTADGSTQDRVDITSAITTNALNHLVIEWVSAGVNFYINGTQVGGKTFTSNLPSTLLTYQDIWLRANDSPGIEYTFDLYNFHLSHDY